MAVRETGGSKEIIEFNRWKEAILKGGHDKIKSETRSLRNCFI